jgi:predicted  nucleic acid-binding Zn-ribbon protein
MGTTLDALLELQDIELQLVDIRRQLAQKQRLVDRQGTRLQTARDRLAVEQERLRRTQVEVDSIDVDLKGRQAHVSRLREHLNTVRTNKEYAAVLAQLNNEKADANRLESRELELMAEVETQRQAVTAAEEAERAEADRLGDFQAQAGSAVATFSDKLSELQARREESINELDPRTVNLFERLSERYEGEVLAKIERTHPRRDEFICSGCHMTISAEHYNAAMVRDDVQGCPNCGRILYIKRRG